MSGDDEVGEGKGEKRKDGKSLPIREWYLPNKALLQSTVNEWISEFRDKAE